MIKKCEICDNTGIIYRSGGVCEYNEMREIPCPECKEESNAIS